MKKIATVSAILVLAIAAMLLEDALWYGLGKAYLATDYGQEQAQEYCEWLTFAYGADSEEAQLHCK